MNRPETLLARTFGARLLRAASVGAATLFALPAAAAPEIRRCTDAAPFDDVAWAIARTVEIRTPDGVGAGVIVSPDGFVLTAAHVVGDDPLVSVVVGDRTLVGRVVRTSVTADLALVRLKGTDFPCMPIHEGVPAVGTEVMAIGSPGGEALPASVSMGIVSGVRQVGGLDLLQTDTAIHPGNSGGPLFADGEVVGIVSFELVGNGLDGIGFAVAAHAADEELGVVWGSETASDLAFRAPPEAPEVGQREVEARAPDPEVFGAWQRRPYAAVRVISGGYPDLYGASGSLYVPRPLVLEVGVSRRNEAVGSLYARGGAALSLREKRDVSDGMTGKLDRAPRYPAFDVLVEPMAGVRFLEDHSGPVPRELLGATFVTAVDLLLWCDSRAAIDFQVSTGATWWIDAPDDTPATMPEIRLAVGMAF